MNRFYSKTQGAISIFLVIILVPMLTVSSVFIDMSRVKLARAVASSAGDLTLNTALTRYDAELKKMYGLMATSQSVDELLGKLDTYFNESVVSAGLSEDDAQLFTSQIIDGLSSTEDVSDFLNISINNKDFTASRLDGGNLIDATLFKSQVVNFMKYRAPINGGLSILNSLQSFVNLSKEMDLIDKRTKYYTAENNVMENCNSAWQKINEYNSTEVNTNANFFTSLKTSFSDGSNSFEARYKAVHTKAVKDLYLDTSNFVNFENEISKGQYGPFNNYPSGQSSGAFDWYFIKTKDNKGNLTIPTGAYKTGSISGNYSSPSYKIDSDDTKSIYPALGDIKTAINNALQSRKALSNCQKPTFFIDNSDYKLRYVVNCLRNYSDYTTKAKSLVNNLQVLEQRYRWIPNAPGHQKNFLSENITLDNKTMSVKQWYADITSNSSQLLGSYCTYADKLGELSKGITDAGQEKTGWANDEISSIYTTIANFDKPLRAAREALTKRPSLLFVSVGEKGALDYLEDVSSALAPDGTLNNAKKTWNNSASALDSSSTMGTQDKAEIKNLGQQFNKDDVDKLIVRLDNIVTGIDGILKAIDDIKYQGVSISKIAGYEGFKNALSSNSNLSNDKNAPVKTAALNNYSDSNFVFVKSAVNTDWVSRDDSKPNLRDGKLRFYTYLYTNFNLTGDMNKYNDITNNDLKQENSDVKNKKDDIGTELSKQAETKAAAADAATTFTATGKTPESISPDKTYPSKIAGAIAKDEDKRSTNKDSAASDASASMTDLFGNLGSFLGDMAVGLRDDMYTTEYIMGMFSYDTIEKELGAGAAPMSLRKQPISPDNNLAYGSEVEYILYGLSKTLSVTSSYACIYGIRFALNAIYAFTTSEIRDTALAIATPISAASLGVIPVPLIQAIIIVGMALAESGIDIVELKGGKEVPLFKTQKTWRLSISGAGNAAYEALKAGAGEVITERSGDLIDQGVSKLSEFLDMSSEQLTAEMNDTTKTVSSDIQQAIDTSFRETIQEQANLAIQQLGTLVTSAVQQNGYEPGKEDFTAYINRELNSWVASDTSQGTAKDAKIKAVEAIINNGYAQKYMDAINSANTAMTSTSTIDTASDLIVKEIDKIRQSITTGIQNELGSAIKDAKLKINGAISEGADSLKQTINDQVDEIFGKPSSGTTGSSNSTGVAKLLNFKYSDYLKVFLIVGMLTEGGESAILARTADVVQANMIKRLDKPDFLMSKAACYVNIKATITVKPLFMALPLIADSTTDITKSGQSWYVVEYNGIKGY